MAGRALILSPAALAPMTSARRLRPVRPRMSTAVASSAIRPTAATKSWCPARVAAEVFGNGGDDVIDYTALGAGSIYGGAGGDHVSVTNNADNEIVGGKGGDTIAVTGDGDNTDLRRQLRQRSR